MKKGGKSANMYVMFSLLAVLFVSLGYLAMQSGGREGMETPAPADAPVMPQAKAGPKKAAFRGGREGMGPQTIPGMPEPPKIKK